MRTLQIFILTAGALALATPALADRGERDDDDRRGKYEKHGKYNKRDDDRHDKYEKSDRRHRHDSFDDHDRVMVRDYYHRHPNRIPPGLAKKGGLPPGQAKKHGMPPGIVRGEVLSYDDHRRLTPLPPDLERLLPPPPHEVVRMVLDQHVVMMHKHTHKVLDILHDALP